ncbi:hypothetical protein D3C71_2160290 [compost metagenome]
MLDVRLEVGTDRTAQWALAGIPGALQFFGDADAIDITHRQRLNAELDDRDEEQTFQDQRARQ